MWCIGCKLAMVGKEPLGVIGNEAAQLVKRLGRVDVGESVNEHLRRELEGLGDALGEGGREGGHCR